MLKMEYLYIFHFFIMKLLPYYFGKYIILRKEGEYYENRINGINC